MHNSSTTDHIATIYRFCAQSMQYPSGDWFDDNYLQSLYLLLETLGGGDEKQQLQHALSNSSDFLEDLQVEHTRLFINGVPHVAAPLMRRSISNRPCEVPLQKRYCSTIVLWVMTLPNGQIFRTALFINLNFFPF